MATLAERRDLCRRRPGNREFHQQARNGKKARICHLSSNDRPASDNSRKLQLEKMQINFEKRPYGRVEKKNG